jgi:hypothetical protein
MSFDISKYTVPFPASLEDMLEEFQVENVPMEQPMKRMSKRFIRPMDLTWFLRARAIAPMAAVMACCLWYRYGLERSRTIKATRQKLAEFGIGKSSSRRILRHMEAAHLVSITWHNARAPEVTLLLDDVQRGRTLPEETSIQEPGGKRGTYP